MQEVSLLPDGFIPTTSFSGGERPTVIRGKNCVIRAEPGRTKIETYPGSKDLSENYNIASETLTGTMTWTVNTNAVVGSGTAFKTQLHIGQHILVGTEPCVVNRITDDTNFVADRPASATQTAVSARYLYTLFEIGRKRGVMRRGNAIEIDRKDILVVGDGALYLNGTTTGVTATRQPQRLQRAVDGTYTAYALGFPVAPPAPVITETTGGWKGMQAGSQSHMIAYWNSLTDETSNPCEVIKKNGGGTALTIAASGRYEFDFTTSLVNMPANADGFKIFSSQSGGGVAAVNTSNYNQGAWLESARIRTTAYTIVDADVDPATDKITIRGHKFRTADSIFFNTTWGPFTADVEYFAIYIDANTIQAAATAADANAKTAINIAGDPGVGSHTIRSLNSADKTYIEYLDAEMGAVASGNNDQPPECEYVTEFANQIHWLSALGKTTTTNPLGTSPGNYVLPSKVGNIGAAPSDWRVSVGDEITGFANGIGRLFCLTANGIPFVTPTGKTELARLTPTLLDMPFSSRPFWTKGGISPNNLIVVQGDVFVYTGRTLLRSPSNADTNVVPYEIGLPVSDLTASWYDGHALLGHCPKNQQICIISSATHKNTAGYWVSQILPYSLQKNEWQPIIELTSDTRDMIVSGVATVGGRMEFLAGGRAPAGAYTISTFQYDERPTSTTPVPYYFALQPSDAGQESKQKYIKTYRVTGRVTSPIIQVHGAEAGEDISISDIENGTNSLSGNIALTTTTGINRAFFAQQLVKKLQLFTIRFSGEWAGTGEVDRIDEIVLGVGVHGMKQ